MNRAYLQLLQAKGLNNYQPVLQNKVQPLANSNPIEPQLAIRPQGFGTRFADAPPEFIAESKEDNGIERTKKPKPKKNKRKKNKKK